MYRDEANLDVTDATNPGYSKRKTYLAGSKIVEICGNLCDDTFECEHYILQSVKTRLKLVRSSNEFNIWCIVANKDKVIKLL